MKKYKSKVTVTFLYTLALVSIIGFLAIVGNTWFNFDFLTQNSSALILIILGIGLIVEGQVLRWRDMAKKGINSHEFAHIVTGVVGTFSLLAGILTLIGIQDFVLDATKGIISSIAIIMIVIQTWVVK